jgi:ferredoxin
MKRKIITIDEELCIGCGLCAQACHEGAIGMVDGKAKLLRDDYCDGLGNCLPVCPTGAITFEEREAVSPAGSGRGAFCESELMQWPVQLKLLPMTAPYYQGAHLLIAADCAAFANGDFHSRFMKGKITMIGCPKLDEGSYAEKLTAIMANNDIASVTVVRMEVPCCGGLANAAIEALKNCGKMIPWQVVTLSVKGEVLS